jgi:HD-like signal output (HDOD) protein
MSLSNKGLSTMSGIAEFFQNVQLPTMPEVAHTLIRTLNDEDVPVEKVRNAISKDPSLTVKLIRLANSARFGLPREVSSVDDAITMVGLNQVRTLSLAACMSDAFPVASGLNRAQFWNESMACAGFSMWIARAVGADAQQAWLTGFMIRLGELIIAQNEPAKLLEIERLPHQPGGRWEREARLIGFTEGQISAELARRWNFPKEVVLALETSSDPIATKPFCRLGGIVHIAMLLAEIAVEQKMTAEETIDALPADVLKHLQLDLDWLKSHLPDVATFTDTSSL